MGEEGAPAPPACYVEARRVHPPLTVAIQRDGEWLDGHLLLWLRASEPDEWYGFCHWWRGRSFYADPVPANRLRVVRNRRVLVHDDDQWRPGTLHGWRRHRDREWEAAVQVPGWRTPAWVPATRVRPE